MTWRVEQGDCLEHLRGMAPESVAVVCTDPPYCSGGFKESERARGSAMISDEGVAKLGWFSGDSMGTSGLVWLLRSVAVQASRILKDGGHLLVFCDWRMLTSLTPAIESAGLLNRNLVVWDKGSAGMGNGFRPQHEFCMHFTKGTGAYQHHDTSNVIRTNRVPGVAKEHPTQKAIPLMRSLLRVVAGPGDLVVDPFVGSGATGEAAVSLGCRFVGFERDARFVELARERIGAAAAAASPGVAAVDGRASQQGLDL